MPAISDALPMSNKVSQGCKSSKSGVGQKTSLSLLVYYKINSRYQSTRYYTPGIIPQESQLLIVVVTT